jgi:hypothetical protein
MSWAGQNTRFNILLLIGGRSGWYLVQSLHPAEESGKIAERVA